jgi:predicted histone-like DNA-binding protein
MAISYHLVRKKDLTPGSPADSRLYFAQSSATRVYSFEELCEDASESSTLTSGDLKIALDRIVKFLLKSLSRGEVAHLNDLGHFQLLARSKGAETEKAFTQAHLKTARLVFRPGAKLREMEQIVACERMAIKEKEVEVPCDHEPEDGDENEKE